MTPERPHSPEELRAMGIAPEQLQAPESKKVFDIDSEFGAGTEDRIRRGLESRITERTSQPEKTPLPSRLLVNQDILFGRDTVDPALLKEAQEKLKKNWRNVEGYYQTKWGAGLSEGIVADERVLSGKRGLGLMQGRREKLALAHLKEELEHNFSSLDRSRKKGDTELTGDGRASLLLTKTIEQAFHYRLLGGDRFWSEEQDKIITDAAQEKIRSVLSAPPVADSRDDYYAGSLLAKLRVLRAEQIKMGEEGLELVDGSPK